MFNRVPRTGFAWRLHLLRDIASAAPAHGAASILSACSPCEGWAKGPPPASGDSLNCRAAGFSKPKTDEDPISGQ